MSPKSSSKKYSLAEKVADCCKEAAVEEVHMFSALIVYVIDDVSPLHPNPQQLRCKFRHYMDVPEVAHEPPDTEMTHS